MLAYAIQRAREQPNIQGQRRLYAVITNKRGRILSEGTNSYIKTHPTQQHYATKVNLPDKNFLHAEMAAMVKIRNGTPHSIYVARVDAHNEPCIAKPCPVCYLAIREAGIKEVFYTE